MLLTRRFEFDASHQLSESFGKCRNLHGHRYTLEVTVQGEVKEGMVMDIAKLKKIANKYVVDKLDHRHINDFMELPTVENIGIWIWNQLKSKIDRLYEVKLYETPNNYVTYRGD